MVCFWEEKVNVFFEGGGGKILFLWCLGKGVEG